MDENLNNLPLDNEEINEEATNQIEEVTDEQTQYDGDVVETASEEEEYIPEWARNSDDVTTGDINISGTDAEEPVIDEEESFEVAPKKKNGKVAAIVSVIIVVILAAIIALGYFYISKRNPYNNMGYINFSGRTIKDIADGAGTSVEEFLAEYSLPADMPEDTHEAAAYYMIPLKKMAEMYGFESVDAMKETFGLGDDVDENTTWGDAESKITLRIYVGEAALEQFKSEYGFGDEITLDTTWGEVRNVVDKKNYEMQLAQEKEAEMNAKAEEAEADKAEKDAGEEAPAAE